ncbi:MAG: type III-B CRISPR module-associated protein Cmr3 [Candidatus Hadarchaeales archaeon]
MWIKIRPIDTLFFRSGRPFSMGDETWSDVIFPPNPSTVYGAIRSFLIFHRGDLNRFNRGYPDIGSPEAKGTMEISGPIIYEESDSDTSISAFYFPAPLDMVKQGHKVVVLSSQNLPAIFISDEELFAFRRIERILINRSNKQIKEIKGFITDYDLIDYLNGERKEFRIIQESLVYEIETKIGIKRNRITKTSEEGFLYQIPLIRLNNKFGFYVHVDEVDNLPNRGFLALGGERKIASFEQAKDNLTQLLNEIKFELNNGTFKVYLATPAIFTQGWLPSWINKKNLIGEFNGIKLKLVGCSLGRCLKIGGWDLAKNKPKQTFKAVSPGSVYYFKVMENCAADEILKAFQMKKISDLLAEEGYGFSFVGVVKK